MEISARSGLTSYEDSPGPSILGPTPKMQGSAKASHGLRFVLHPWLLSWQEDKPGGFVSTCQRPGHTLTHGDTP